jgi:hypothetical protein
MAQENDLIKRGGPSSRVLVLAMLLLGGCAALPRGPIALEEPIDAVCLGLFERSDAEIREAGVADGGARRIPGFPWLRTDRLLASFRNEVAGGERFAAWLHRLSELDQQARTFELQNLDAAVAARLAADWRGSAARHELPQELGPGLDACRQQLNAAVTAAPAAASKLRGAASVPDDYRTWQRILGLYAVTGRIARSRVVALHDRLGARFGAEPSADVVRYAAPVAAGSRPAASPVPDLPRDALGIPSPGGDARAALYARHAPIWAIETGSSADRPGMLVIDADRRPLVPPVQAGHGTQPPEYRWLSWTRFGDDVLLQLNYALWFSERPPTRRLDIVAGHLDGVVWRVTIDRDGEVLAYDSIHLCGCYYTLLPGARHAAASVPWHAEPVFAPRRAPSPDDRLVVRLESTTHYLVDVATDAPVGPVTALSPTPMAALRSLPTPDGGRFSAFGPDGLIAASRRLERFVLWPLGVPSAGAMRQPGRHAIAFIGRRHFDDPFLFEDLLTPWPTD